MDINQLLELIEALRRRAIGEPTWQEKKQAFEYGEQSAKTVAVLKLVRAAQGLTSLDLLRQAGLFIDFGAIVRCVNDCIEDIYFLLESFPNESNSVNKYVIGFFENTIDGYLTGITPPVRREKIRNAMVRVLKGNHYEKTRNLMENVYVAFCGYIHANYAHVMEVYNGAADDFNLRGVPSPTQRLARQQHVELATESVLYAAIYTTQALGLNDVQEKLIRVMAARSI